MTKFFYNEKQLTTYLLQDVVNRLKISDNFTVNSTLSQAYVISVLAWYEHTINKRRQFTFPAANAWKIKDVDSCLLTPVNNSWTELKRIYLAHESIRNFQSGWIFRLILPFFFYFKRIWSNIGQKRVTSKRNDTTNKYYHTRGNYKISFSNATLKIPMANFPFGRRE